MGDGKSFAKLCKDCKLIDNKFTSTDVDLIFAKVVPKGQRRIAFKEFEAALAFVARKKGGSTEDIEKAVCASQGPSFNATKADYVAFHDDKSTFTGMHVHGGPASVPKGVGKRPSVGHECAWGAKDISIDPQVKPEKAGPSPPAQNIRSQPAGSLQEAFVAFAGPLGMDGKTFAKVCKDARLLDKQHLTPTDVDLIFAKVVPKGQRKIDFAQFEAALGFVARKKNVDVETVSESVRNAGGPVLTGTKAGYVAFHDDTSTYTGVHVHGGPDAGVCGQGTVADSSWKRPD